MGKPGRYGWSTGDGCELQGGRGLLCSLDYTAEQDCDAREGMWQDAKEAGDGDRWRVAGAMSEAPSFPIWCL